MRFGVGAEERPEKKDSIGQDGNRTNEQATMMAFGFALHARLERAEMNTNDKRSRWQFNLRTLIIAVFVLCAICAANLSAGKPQLMFQFGQEDGGGSVYAVPFGWPLPYLRIPTGDHTRLPADLFLPGLIVDLGVAIVLMVTVVYVWNVVNRFKLLPIKLRWLRRPD